MPSAGAVPSSMPRGKTLGGAEYDPSEDAMSDVTNRVLIIGAGFAGLSAAISLAGIGKQVTLAERSDSLADGAAITLSNRAPDALAELGVYEEALEAGV